MRQKAVRDFFAFWITNNEQRYKALNVINKRVLNIDINGGDVMQLRCLVGENEGETVCLRNNYFCPWLKAEHTIDEGSSCALLAEVAESV